MTYIREPEFQIFQCTNEDCRFRCPSNLSMKRLEYCPFCGSSLIPATPVYANLKNASQPKSGSTRTVSVLLDNLRSTLNVGSIFRTADGAGVSSIHLCGTTPTPEHAKIKKTGLGAEWSLPWDYHRNGLDFVTSQKQSGVFIVSVETSPLSSNIFNAVLPDSRIETLLIMGNEVSGIDPDILNLSDQILHIPMSGVKSSLNVSVAFGIAVYTLLFAGESHTTAEGHN